MRATEPLAARPRNPRAKAPDRKSPDRPPQNPPEGGRPARAQPKRGGRRWLKWLFLLAVWGSVAVAAMLLWFARDLPRPEAALDASRKPSLTIEDRAGRTLAVFGDRVGEPLRLRDLPPDLPEAVVSVEDRRFWSHPGFDPIGLARAVWVNVSTGRVAQGGSTVTQQVAKNLFLTNARTFKRKVQEVMLTIWLEQSFSKKEILEIWLNRVYLGSGAWGVDAAAKTYFGISARDLNLWQSAMLAGLPRAPSRFNPRHDPNAAAARTREVLAAMVATGSITEEQSRQAAAQINVSMAGGTSSWFADWAAERAQSLLPIGADAIVRTTLDARSQEIAQRQVQTMLAGPGFAAHATQAAVIVLDAQNGAVRAMVGGRAYSESAFNRAVAARRQPGSAFKPFVFLAALERGARPDDTVSDAPIRLGTWNPQNFERGFRGDITLEEALAHSVNTAAVRLLLSSGGPRAAIAAARRLGITSSLPDDASVALGTGEVSLIEIASAYASFFNGGRAVPARALERMTADGKPVALPDASTQNAVDPSIASMMARMMAAVVARGSGTAAALPGRTVAGKTGTTQDYRDAWFIGWTNGMIIGVWLGNDDNSPMKNITGGSLPAKLFHDIAAEIR